MKIATGKIEEEIKEKKSPRKKVKAGEARAAAMTPEERTEFAKAGALVRWQH